MNTWRLLPFEKYSAALNMAIDEAVLTARVEQKVPNTLRFYQWHPSAVSIGKDQDPQEQVYIETCREKGVDIVRRISGGGTVFHDQEGEVTYSVVARTSDMATKDVKEVYDRIYSGIVDALRLLGVSADFNEGDSKNCPNLTVGGKKISGSAQAYKRGVALQHGTVLLSANLELMFSLLRVPWSKSCMEVVGVARKKITSIEAELGHYISEETVSNALEVGFRNAFGIQLVRGELTSFELELANRLCRKKYSSDSWNLHGNYVL